MFSEGQRVRISVTAFGDSTETNDVLARGQAGQLVQLLDDNAEDALWLWVGDDGTETCPVTSELEAI